MAGQDQGEEGRLLSWVCNFRGILITPWPSPLNPYFMFFLLSDMTEI